MTVQSCAGILRNGDIKKPCREVSQKTLRNRAVPPRGPKKLAIRTESGSLSRERVEEHPIVLAAVVVSGLTNLGGT